MAEGNDRPRWATELGPETWERLNELVDAGWKTMDIVRELELPESKVRSLQIWVRKHGPRRRLIQFARFKDALLSQIEEFGDELAQSLSVIAALAVSDKTKGATQVRALEAMTEFAKVLRRIMQDDAKEEEERQLEETGGPKIDVNEVVRRVLERYGVDGGSDGDG